MTRDITCAKFAHMGIDADQTYITELYNLDVIISVGSSRNCTMWSGYCIFCNNHFRIHLRPLCQIVAGLSI